MSGKLITYLVVMGFLSGANSLCPFPLVSPQEARLSIPPWITSMPCSVLAEQSSEGDLQAVNSILAADIESVNDTTVTKPNGANGSSTVGVSTSLSGLALSDDPLEDLEAVNDVVAAGRRVVLGTTRTNFTSIHR